MQQLNHIQVVLSGTNLIEASAGTGKTYAIASLYLRPAGGAGAVAGAEPLSCPQS